MEPKSRTTGFTADHVYSQNAVCASGFEVEGVGMTITNSTFANNGWAIGEDTSTICSGQVCYVNPPVFGQWADGATVYDCYGGTISNNTFTDNTDVNLVLGGGNRQMTGNTISNANEHGFAGLIVGWFDGGKGNHAGAYFSNNTVTSGQDMLSFGIMVGYHPWDISKGPLPDAGNVGSGGANSSSGAVVNLAIDGISAGTIQQNAFSNTRGTAGFNCSKAADYTAAHFGNANYQPGSICRVYDSDAACYDPPPPCPAVR
jgi:hypothetical protein